MANEIRTEELVKLNELVKWHEGKAQACDKVGAKSNAEQHRATARLLTAQAASLGECVKAMCKLTFRHAAWCPGVPGSTEQCNCGHDQKLRAHYDALTRARAVQAGGDPYAKVVEAARKAAAIVVKVADSYKRLVLRDKPTTLCGSDVDILSLDNACQEAIANAAALAEVTNGC